MVEGNFPATAERTLDVGLSLLHLLCRKALLLALNTFNSAVAQILFGKVPEVHVVPVDVLVGLRLQARGLLASASGLQGFQGLTAEQNILQLGLATTHLSGARAWCQREPVPSSRFNACSV